MKNAIALLFFFLMLTMTSCELIGDIFSAGFYTALALVLLVVIIIVYLIAKLRGRR